MEKKKKKKRKKNKRRKKEEEENGKGEEETNQTQEKKYKWVCVRIIVDDGLTEILSVGERCGEWWKQVGGMNEESQVSGCYNITFNYTNQETVYVLEKTQANKTFRTWKQT